MNQRPYACETDRKSRFLQCGGFWDKPRIMTGREFSSNLMYIFKCLIYPTVALIVILVVLSCFASRVYVWERDAANYEWIEKAYVRFCRDTKQYPTNLLELVAAGYLPPKSPRY